MPFVADLARRLARLRRRLAASRDGNILMIMGFITVPLVFAIGFGLDYSKAEKTQTRLDAAADAAALSAVSSTAMNQNVTTASLAAQAINTFVAQVPGFSGSAVSATASGTAAAATASYSLAAPTASGMTGSITITATVSNTGQFNTGRTAVVTWKGFSKNGFSTILGATTLTISGTAQASADAAPNINFFLAMDNSPSMLLPSTTTGLSNIRAAFANTLNSPYGCDFACHEQNPHNDNIYVYDSSGREVYLPTTAYSTNAGGSGQTYMFANESTGAIYDSARTVMSGYIYCTSPAAAVYRTSACRNATVANQVAGYWADGYWLTHNYGVINPGQPNIDLRINDEISAAQDLIPFAQSQATANQVTYRMQMFAYNWTHTGATSPVTTLTASMTNVASLTTSSVPNIDATQDYWYTNNCPYNGTCNSDQGTETTNMLSYMNSIMPNTGDGSSASSPQEVLFIITDGMSDESTGGSRWNREFNSTDLAQCTAIKNRNIRIAILYTQYLPDALTGDGWSQSNVAPYVGNVAGALQSCASTGSSGAPLFYQVTTDQSISQALSALFALTIQSAHLVK